jgi:hypothetical protein
MKMKRPCHVIVSVKAPNLSVDFDLLRRVALRSKHVKLESAKPAMAIIVEGVERELMRTIK